MNKKRKILNFISQIRDSHPSIVDIYTKGSCLNFHLILRSVFPAAKPYTNIDHIISKIDSTYYDINGIVYNTKNYYPYGGKGFSQMLKFTYKI